MMVVETYKEKKDIPRESALAKAYKEGTYQESLMELLNGKKKTKRNMFSNK